MSVLYHASCDDQGIINSTASDIALKVREARIAKSATILIGKQLNPEGQAVVSILSTELNTGTICFDRNRTRAKKIQSAIGGTSSFMNRMLSTGHLCFVTG